MDGLRRWELRPDTDFSINLSADARISRTTYTNDQTWRLSTGAIGSPALTLQTQYGGLVDMATIIPMWVQDGKSIYEAQDYAQIPRITHFAPGYARIEAYVTESLFLVADYRVIDSQIICGMFTLKNEGNQEQTVHLDLLGQVIEKRKERQLGILQLSDNSSALSMGLLVGLAPVLVLEGATTDLENIRISPKIGQTITIQSGDSSSLCWVHTGKADTETSLAYALSTLRSDWRAMLDQIHNAASYIPKIGTGDDNRDLMIALAYQHLMQSIIDPAGEFTNKFLVGKRTPDHGHSKKGDGTDYLSDWRGISIHDAYMSILSLASVAPDIAQGMILNLLSTQKPDGWIDFRVAPQGTKGDLLATPLLARLSWNCYKYTQDEDFLKTIFPALLKFFRRWFKSDVDQEFDGLPEWQDLDQIGYPFLPTFARTAWGQGVDVRYVEAPDMAAYLLSEALSLLSIASVLNDAVAESSLSDRIGKLQNALKMLKQGKNYAYRDRDTDESSTAITLLDDGRGDETHPIAIELDTPSRLIIEIHGGSGKPPKATLKIEGQAQNGQIINEQSPVSDAFDWYYNSGRYTTRHTFSSIKNIQIDGLSRIYKVSARTVDTSRLDISALLPLWSGGIPDTDSQLLIELLTDDTHFWQENGVSVVSASDKNYDPASKNGGGGVWAYFTTLIAEGLLDYGDTARATSLLTRYLDVQTRVFNQEHEFYSGYHSHKDRGLGTKLGLNTLPPLHLLTHLSGIHIISTAKVWVGGAFHFEQPIEVVRLGVKVTRSAKTTLINFPSGHLVELPPDADYQLIEDPNPAPQTALTQSIAIEAPPTSSDRVIIEVEDEDNNPDNPI